MNNMRKNLFIVLIVLVLVLGVLIARGFLPGSQTVPEGIPLSYHEELYQLQNPFIGDASANGRILQAVLPQEETGPFHMELETTDRPHVLRVIFEEIPENPDWLDDLMQQQGLLMLALIDNADAIEWAYPLEIDGEPEVSDVRLTRDDLFEALDISEEEFSLSPEMLEQLLEL